MLKYIACFVLCSLLLDVKANQFDGVENEVQCLSAGGMCVQTDMCPDDKRVKTKGLCPLQRDKGVECCYSISENETRCSKRGGECFPKYYRCPENLTFSKATDCADDEKCCILV